MNHLTSKYPIKQLTIIFIISVSIKILLIPAYFSTDFDVHQNWLRITNTQPINNWYYDIQSKWTLDYPPLFAYFQLLLSKISNLFNQNISNNINKNIQTIYYQRITVILSQIPFLLILYHIIKKINFIFIISYFSIPFIILDNIHFQYNIIMQSIFILSIYYIQEKSYLKGAFVYSCLLNFKHIYLYSSIAFLAYLLKHYVFKPQTFKDKIINLIKVGTVTIIPFIISFLPFIITGGIQQIPQIFSRLFPFQRGLIHQYWAPNFWALYHFLDKLINILSSRFHLTKGISFRQISSDLHQLKVLPEISPFITTLIILILTIPIIIKLINHDVKFNKLVFICGTLFFLFGFHVHEKAITPYISLLLIFIKNEDQNKNNYIYSAIFINIINLLPLLINDNQKLLRIILPFVWIAIWENRNYIEDYLQTIILAIGITINIYHQLIHPFIQSNRLQFLPLMLNSVFSATFNICWITIIYYNQIRLKPQEIERENKYDRISVTQD